MGRNRMLLSRLIDFASRLASAAAAAAVADERHFATTDDGWRLALHRYKPAAGSSARAYPVILCHGLAANRFGFDLAPEVSLARRLAALGFDVFALELRGHGDSDPASLRGPRRWGWSFDDYLRRDMPAAIDRVRALTGAPLVHWVGHSMGGILLYAYLASTGGSGLASGTAIGSSLDYSASASGFHRTLRLRALGRYLPAIPLGRVIRLGAPLMGRYGTSLERFNLWPENVEGHFIRALHTSGFHTVSTPVLLQLATAFEAGGMRSWDGTRRYLDDLRAARLTTPVLVMGADRDEQCPPSAIELTYDALGGPKRLALFGLAHGHLSHYGHFDLIIGRHAAREVWPSLEEWLLQHDQLT
jgi:polyhydroxyalkanoate synthase subunit PhaC